MGDVNGGPNDGFGGNLNGLHDVSSNNLLPMP